MNRFEQSNVTGPVIIQGVGGDLRLRGGSGRDLLAEGDQLHVEQASGERPLVIRAGGDARVSAPDTAPVTVRSVGGDAKLTDLSGPLIVETVGGDLIARGIADLQIKTVGGDLRIKRADGNVTAQNVGADVTVRDVEGAVWIANVGADLYIRNVEGSCVAENVGADLVLSIEFKPGQEYRFGAGSDILCRVPPDAHVTFVAPSHTDLNLEMDAEVERDADGDTQIVTVGEGSATVRILEASSLQLVGDEEDYIISLGAQIEEELDVRLSSLEEKLSRQLEGLDERIADKTEKLARRAQRQAERAKERVVRGMERQWVRRKRSPGPRRIVFDTNEPSAPPSDPVTEQERLMILEMVRDNKISIEEAERLLAALER